MFCESVKSLDKKINGLSTFVVDDDYNVNINGHVRPLDEEIRERGLPALIHNDTVYIGEKHILDFVEKIKSGE